MRRAAWVIGAFLWMSIAAPTQAAEQPVPAGSIDFAATAKEVAERNAAGRAAGAPVDASAELAARDEMRIVRSNEWNADFRQRSFEWHLLSTKIIFTLVIVIVVFGLFLTYLQFKKDYTDPVYVRPPTAPPEGDPAAAAAAPATPSPLRPVTTMKLGPGGLELSSQLIGLAVLAFSLGFFYLYVKEVYPVHETSLAASPPAPAPNAK